MPDLKSTRDSESIRRWPLTIAAKPDMEQCLDRIDAWFKQQVLDRPPVRFYTHNKQVRSVARHGSLAVENS